MNKILISWLVIALAGCSGPEPMLRANAKLLLKGREASIWRSPRASRRQKQPAYSPALPGERETWLRARDWD